MRYYVADFESTTNPIDCRVWAYAIAEVANAENIRIGTTIDEFMAWCANSKENSTVYFHNMKWDIQFIIHWLFSHDFKWVPYGAEKEDKTFTTSINSLGIYYLCEITFKKRGRKVNKVTIYDSSKLLPLKVEEIAKSFKLPYQKLKIDYDAHNDLPEGAPLAANEIEYVKNDVRIVAMAINIFHEMNLTKMTIGSCAMQDFKNIITEKNFKIYFPPPIYHNDVKLAYKGGFVWLNPEYQNKRVKFGIVLDYKSHFAAIMHDELLPYGAAMEFEGQYEQDDHYPLFIQHFRCQFELKPGKIPMVQLKKATDFGTAEYLTSSHGEEITLTMTKPEFELFQENYDIYNPEYIAGWKYKGSRSFFKEYVTKWYNKKYEAERDGNAGLRAISKLFLTSLYGKFGQSIKVQNKIPYMENGIVKYKNGPEEEKDGVYIAMSAFITAYARKKIILDAQYIEDRFHAGLSKARYIYSDTDSLHIDLGIDDIAELIPAVDDFMEECGLNIHETELGALDHESTFTDAIFIRSKCYMEKCIISKDKYTEGINSDESYLYSHDDYFYYKNKITVAGMPKDCQEHVTFDNFKVGTTYAGKKQPVAVQGGVILQDIDFTIKQ